MKKLREFVNKEMARINDELMNLVENRELYDEDLLSFKQNLLKVEMLTYQKVLYILDKKESK